MLERAEVGAKTRNVTLHLVEARQPDQLAPAFLTMRNERADAIVVFPSPMFFDNRKLIADLTIKHRMPAVFNGRDYVEDGGLVSYGANLNDLWRRAGGYVDRILKGAKPGDLPIEQPTKFELVIDLKAAKALGLIVPQTLLARADEVIE
jgi:ABC-type uncharacterized transport system substrate-binding protein